MQAAPRDQRVSDSRRVWGSEAGRGPEGCRPSLSREGEAIRVHQGLEADAAIRYA